MFKDLKVRVRLKQYLIFSNIGLGVALSILLVSWLAYVRPSQINTAIAQNQYGYYNIKNLPNKSGEIETDYFGKSKIAELEEKIDVADSGADDSELGKSDSLLSSEELLDKSTELLEKTNKFLGAAQNNQDESSVGEGGESVSLKSNIKSDGKPKIALLITNLGLNRRSTELALTLPNQCALGFLPYTKTLKPLLNKAQSSGHEIYLYLPLQTSKSSDNPGKYALTTNLAPEEVAVRLSIILNSHAKYDGVYSSFREVFTDNIQASSSVFEQIADKHLIFIMGRGRADKVVKHFKMHNNIIPANIVLDEEADRKSIKIKLEALAKLAEKNGVALGYSQGFTLTIEMIREWLPSLQKRGILIVPISALSKDQK